MPTKSAEAVTQKQFNHQLCLQIPDIYDSAKYDANHNDHLNLDISVIRECESETKHDCYVMFTSIHEYSVLQAVDANL